MSFYTRCKWSSGRVQGRSDGVDIGIYTPSPQKKSAQVNFLWGKMKSERLFNSFIHPQKLLYPSKTNFWLCPCPKGREWGGVLEERAVQQALSPPADGTSSTVKISVATLCHQLYVLQSSARGSGGVLKFGAIWDSKIHYRNALMHNFQGYFSRTFRDLKLQFPGLLRTKVIFQDFPGSVILKKKSRTFQEAWEPWPVPQQTAC